MDEPRRLGLAAAGHRAPRSWAAPHDPLDFYDLKGAVDDLLAALDVSGTYAPVEEPFFHPAASAALTVGGRRAGVLGQIHPSVARTFDVPETVLLAELDWELLLSQARSLRESRGVPRFPAVARDLAFVVSADAAAATLLAEIRAADAKGLLEQVTLFDVYRGAQVPAGKKSVAVGLTLRAPDRTLTDGEADGLIAKVKDRLKSSLGAEIRS